jgi:hypothetical protein
LHKHSGHIGNSIGDSEKYLLTLDMGANINQYTIKRLVKFAYSLKQDEDWVITRVWEEFLREEKKYMTDELRETYFAEYQKFEPFIREQCKYLEAERRKKAILADIHEATARAMINELSEEHLVALPKIFAVKATDAGRVTIEFNSPNCIIDAPSDHLRARLIRRFTNKKHKA